MKPEKNARERMEKWDITSPEASGFHEVIIPNREDCSVVNVFRLNLPAGETYQLKSGGLEMNAVLISGHSHIKNDFFNNDMEKYDSFYIPGSTEISIKANEDSVFYIGGAVCEKIGKAFFRKFDKDLPLGGIHQIHGSGVGQREVYFTLNPEVPASRLICGLTWSRNGTWTSWPPHQHERDLEEVYCYCDMNAPKFGLHVSYLKSGEIEDLVVHTVRSGSMVLAPCGYHPTVASPGTCNTYFWILASFSHASRRYDLAVTDPVFLGT